jgi:hypothetical protein
MNKIIDGNIACLYIWNFDGHKANDMRRKTIVDIITKRSKDHKNHGFKDPKKAKNKANLKNKSAK